MKKIFITLVVLLIVLIISLVVFLVPGNAVSNTAKGYANSQLYNNAILMANNDSLVNCRFGTLSKLETLAIFEGDTQFFEVDSKIKTSVKVKGEKRNGRIDIEAHFINEAWQYIYLAVRIKKPVEEKETIVIIPK